MKIRVISNGSAIGPVFGILSRTAPFKHGSPPSWSALYGKTLYSPRHHLDAAERPIPARCARDAMDRPVPGVYVPSLPVAVELRKDRAPIFEETLT